MAQFHNKLDWDDLRFFLSTARAGRLTGAGQALKVDHATVSRRINALELACGARLFDRSPRGYALTEAGRKLLPFAESIENSAINAIESLSDQSHDISGVVRIGAPDGIAQKMIAGAAADLCKTHSDLEIQIIAAPRQFSLSRREADFAIAVSQPTSGRLKTYKISDYQLHLYASDTFLREHGSLDNTKVLKHVRGIGYVSDLIFDKKLDYIPLVGPDLRPHLTSTNLLIQLEWALSGAGVCILPDFLAGDHPSLKPILTQEIAFTRSFWMILHQDLVSIARIKRVADHVAQNIRTHLKHVGGAFETAHESY